MQTIKLSLIIVSLSSLLVACSEVDKPATLQTSTSSPVKPITESAKLERPMDTAKLVRGGQLFKQNCAVCHGDNAQGANEWHKRDENGKFPAPPLNGTGHTWHHPMSVLKYTVKNGTSKIGGNMPAFAGKLTDSQIEDIFSFVQEKWPEPIYEAWYRTNEMSRKNNAK